MKKVAIMTDTVACIPQELVKEYGIKVIPFHVIMGGKSYVETEINMNQLYAWLGEKENLPTTSAPSVGEFLQAYQELSQGAESILHISMTSAFTMAYGAAIEAKEMAREELPQTTIEVLDSQTVCSSELLIVLEAARAAARGEDLTKVMGIS